AGPSPRSAVLSESHCVPRPDRAASPPTSMKKPLSFTVIVLALAWSAQAANSTVKLSNVHLCCGGCTTGVEKALARVYGATVQTDKDAHTVTITAPDQATAQKAVDAVVAAGYFGSSSDPAITVADKSGAEKGKLHSLKISGVHLCCGKCVTAV